MLYKKMHSKSGRCVEEWTEKRRELKYSNFKITVLKDASNDFTLTNSPEETETQRKLRSIENK